MRSAGANRVGPHGYRHNELCRFELCGDYTNVLDRHHRGEFKDLATLQKAVIDEEIVLLKKAHFQSTNGSVAAAARTTDANLAPERTKAEKRKAKKARKRAKALAATGESTSTDSAACATDGTTDAHA